MESIYKPQITIVRTINEVVSIRPLWQKLQSINSHATFNADVDRYLSVIQSFREKDINPYVLLLRRADEPLALVAGRIEKHTVASRIGYKVIQSTELKCLTVVYGGVIGQIDEDISKELVNQLMSVLRRGDADVVWLSHLKTDCPFYDAVRTMPGFLCRGHLPIIQDHWVMSVPQNMDCFYQNCSKKHRGNLKRYKRKLHRDYPKQVEVKTYTKEEEVEEAIHHASRISSQTYQSGLNKGLEAEAATLNLMKTATRKGWLLIDTLYVGNEPCAFQIGMKYRNMYLLDQIGYSSHWGNYNVGTILFIHVLERLCKDPDVKRLDFGFGDAEYKRIYGNQKWSEASVYIFARRLNPVYVNFASSLINGFSYCMVKALNKTGITQIIKKKWRNRLIRRST